MIAVLLSCLLVSAICCSSQNNYPANSEINNEEWLDIEGNLIHAHDGSIVEYNQIFYWIGGSIKLQITSNITSKGWASEGINCYSSTDLVNWKFEEMIFKNTSLKINEAGPYKLNNPYIVHNEKNNNFMLWMRIDIENDSLRQVAVAKSDGSICSEYEFVNTFRPDGYPTGDLGVYKDIDQYNKGNNAYLIRNVANDSCFGISMLNEDYTDTTNDGIISKGPHLEGLSLFKLSTFYVWGSHLTGWIPNANDVCVTNEENTLNNAVWSNCHNPTDSSTTYNSQDTSVVRFVDNVNNKYTFMYMGDIWNYPNISNATYVWLPLNFKNNHPESFPHVSYYKTWHIGLHNVSIPN